MRDKEDCFGIIALSVKFGIEQGKPVSGQESDQFMESEYRLVLVAV